MKKPLYFLWHGAKITFVGFDLEFIEERYLKLVNEITVDNQKGVHLYSKVGEDYFTHKYHWWRDRFDEVNGRHFFPTN